MIHRNDNDAQSVKSKDPSILAGLFEQNATGPTHETVFAQILKKRNQRLGYVDESQMTINDAN